MQSQKDHDVLIRLDQKVDILTKEVRDLKDNFAKRIEALEDEKISKADVMTMKRDCDATHADHEMRIRTGEAALWKFAGVAMAGGTLLSLVGSQLIKALFK